MSNLKFMNKQMISSNNGHVPSPLPRPNLEMADGVFDAPSVKKHQTETAQRLAAVSPKWRCGMVGDEVLAIFVPIDQEVLGLSKEKFVDLLEFAEDKLEVNQVLAVFEKPNLSLNEGFPRTLRYVGFRPIAPENHPAELPAEKCFIMAYTV